MDVHRPQGRQVFSRSRRWPGHTRLVQRYGGWWLSQSRLFLQKAVLSVLIFRLFIELNVRYQLQILCFVVHVLAYKLLLFECLRSDFLLIDPLFPSCVTGLDWFVGPERAIIQLIDIPKNESQKAVIGVHLKSGLETRVFKSKSLSIKQLTHPSCCSWPLVPL